MADKVVGKIKEPGGKALGNKDRKAEGKGQQGRGHLKGAKGELKETFKGK